MAQFQVCFKKYVPKVKRERILISPEEKFARLRKKISAKSKSGLRKFHFNAIESGKIITVFDGEGFKVVEVLNNVTQLRIARQLCLMLFLKSENQNGGFEFTHPPIGQSIEELVEMQKVALSQTNTVILCDDCRFRFEEKIEKQNHRCTGIRENGWTILEFQKVRRMR